MKTNKTFTLDIEVANRLKEEGNSSGLINELLIKHYEIKDMKKMPKDERLIYLKKLRAIHYLKEKHKKEVAKLEDGN